jgi:biotin--protein ligase
MPTGTVFTTSEQSAGRGRGKNTWISQKGCLMFSLRITHKQGSSLIFLQYLAGLAVIQAVKCLEGCSSIPLALKWPNDIYVKNLDGSLKKIGGILVTSEYSNDIFCVTIGCGLNVLNRKPSTCLQEYTNSSLNIEMVLAKVITEFESLYTELLNSSIPGDPFADFRERYYTYWLHSAQQVQVKGEDGSLMDVTIRGLDPSGFLKARDHQGQVILLQPDGNSFDMVKGNSNEYMFMLGLITVK